jgi:hypothetical protein
MKIKGSLPKGDSDGLSALEAQLNKDPEGVVAALVILDVASRAQDNDTKEWTVTLRLRRIEPILKADKATASQLVGRAYEARTGQATLPIELENELRDAVEGLDLYQPETPPQRVEKGSPYGVMAATELRDELRRRGLDGEGKKADLVDRLISDDSGHKPELLDVPPLTSEPEPEPPLEITTAPLPIVETDNHVPFSDGGVNWSPEADKRPDPMWGQE